MSPAEPPPPVLAAQGLHKSFHSGSRAIEVLRGASLQVSAGESVSLRGESGCGKTTFLNLLSGLELADSGSVHWAGQDLARLSAGSCASLRASHLGLVFQAYYLVPELDALGNVLLAARMLGPPNRETRQRARDLLHAVGLDDRLRASPGTLSGGERQRVAIARALVNRPAALLADEPTGNLDEKTGAAVMDLLLQVCHERSTSLVLVTHNLAFARRTARALVLQDGVLHPD